MNTPNNTLQNVKNSQIGERISQVRDYFFGGANREFAAKIGIGEQNLSTICGSKRSPGIEVIIKIVSNLPALNARWLITGEGDIITGVVANTAIGNNNVGSIVQGRTVNNAAPATDYDGIITSQQQTIERLTKIIDNLMSK